MLMPARSDFRSCRLRSMLFSTALTRPAPCPRVVVGVTTASALKIMIAIKPRRENSRFINSPYIKPLGPTRKKPSNYREQSAYVNLVSQDPSILTDPFSNLYHLRVGPPRHSPDAILQMGLILFVSNRFSAHEER